MKKANIVSIVFDANQVVREINFRAIGFRNQVFWKEKKKIRQVSNEKRTDEADGI